MTRQERALSKLGRSGFRSDEVKKWPNFRDHAPRSQLSRNDQIPKLPDEEDSSSEHADARDDGDVPR